jgi:branched-chain amino acid transport system ATP-binding protein
VLDVREIDVCHGDLQALWGVSLEVNRGEVVALIGPNGAGKTTLLRTIVGLHRPLAGSIVLQDEPIHTIPAHRIVERGVVLVPEGRRLFGGLTVLENLEMGAYTARARRERARTLAWVLEVFPVLAERRSQLAMTMSGGQQQMLAIGRALMGRPELLLLDEPSLGLAPIVVQNIFDTIKLINERGVTVILVEQNARIALELASRAYVLEQGRVAEHGTGAELLADTRVQQAYLGVVEAASPPDPLSRSAGEGERR